MFFDDRLATVLRQRATGEANLRTQFRQLLDLLGRDPAGTQGSEGSLIAAAWLRLEVLGEAIPPADRARMIREPGWRFRNPALAAHLAEQEPEVASAALTRAELAAEDWSALIPLLPVSTRGFLRLRRDLPVDIEALLARLGVHDRSLPPPEEPVLAAAPRQVHLAAPAGASLPHRRGAAIPLHPAPVQAEPPPAPPRSRDDSGRSEISALVERIAQFRRERGTAPVEQDRSPRLPLGELPERIADRIGSFGFAADSSGRIAWAASEAAPMVVGTRLFASLSASDDPVARAFARRQPIARAAMALDGAPAIAGEWIVDAEPRFSEEGHFTGYLGRFRRVPDAAPGSNADAREADRIRQLLHELRTPVTAVQGYAEVIQQQLFGPAPHEYRALAAAIAADAARILAGFEELDRLARLETGALAIEAGECDLAALVRRTAGQLAAVLDAQAAGLTPAFADTTSLLIAIDPEDAEALLWRLLASLASVCAPGERIAISLDPLIGDGRAVARLVCALPASLAAQEQIFTASVEAGPSAINAGLFGTGFTLRLARAEAQAAGGGLKREGSALVLTLPLLGRSVGLRGAAEI